MKNNPISRPKSLAAIVADKLKESILRRELSLGEALSEEGIANAMGVSRTPVREALTMLQLQGLINIQPQRGSFVFKPDAEDLANLVEYRLKLEILAAELALKNDPEGTYHALLQVIERMEKARVEDDSLAYAYADNSFHNVIFEHCGNHYFAEAYDIVAGKIAALRSHLSAPLGLHRDNTHQEHIAIAEAFKDGDRVHLRRLVVKHISAMTPNYGKVLKVAPEKKAG